LILSTGEQRPPGQSIVARLLLIEMDPGTVDLGRLTEAQAHRAHLSHAMAGDLGWLAPQMGSLPTLLRERFDGARARASSGGDGYPQQGHPRSAGAGPPVDRGPRVPSRAPGPAPEGPSGGARAAPVALRLRQAEGARRVDH